MNTKKIKSHINLITFFLKNIWFAPSVNFLFVLFAMILLILRGGQDLKMHDVLISMFSISLTAYCTGNIVFDKHRKVTPYFIVLPLSTKQLLKTLAISGFLYSLIVQSVLTIILYASLGFPFIGNPHVTMIEVPSGEVISMAEGYIVALDGRTEIPYSKTMRPSLIFGIVQSSKGWPVFPFWHILFILYFTLLTFYFITCHHIRPQNQHTKSLFYWIIAGVSVCLAVLSVVDFFLPSKFIWHLRTYCDKAIWIFPLFLSCIVLILVIALYQELTKLQKSKELSN